MGDGGARDVAMFLATDAGQKLRSLRLESNLIGESGGRALEEVLRGSLSLTLLELGANPLQVRRRCCWRCSRRCR